MREEVVHIPPYKEDDWTSAAIVIDVPMTFTVKDIIDADATGSLGEFKRVILDNVRDCYAFLLEEKIREIFKVYGR